MNEEFAISLKTILDSSSIATVKSQLSQLKQHITGEIEEATSPAKVTTEVFDTENVKQYSAQIQLLKAKIIDLQTTLSAADSIGLKSMDILKIEAEIERLQNKIASLQNGGNSGFTAISKTTVAIKNNIGKATASVGRILGSLVGVAGVYGSIRKAMSTYLAQNDELKAKIDGCWYALGSLFAPVVEYVVNLFVRLVSLVDALVKSLGFAGVNMANYGKATGKAAKQQKQLAGFDELNNLNSQSSGGSGGAGFKLDPVSDEALKKFKDILELVTAIGLAIAAWKVAEGIASLFGKTLDPMTLLGISLAVGGITLAIMGLLDYLKDPSWENFGKFITGIGIALTGLGLIIGSTPLIIAGAIIAILGLIAPFWDNIKAWIDNAVSTIDSKMSGLHAWLEEWFGEVGNSIFGHIQFCWDVIKGFVDGVKQLLDGLFKGTKNILDGIIKIFKGDFQGGIRQVGEGLKQIFKGILNAVISIANGVISAVQNAINYVIRGLNSLTFTVPSWVPYAGGMKFGLGISEVNFPRIPSFDVGTNYVPNDMIAQLHQGEAVIPKEFNENSYVNSEETNDLLRQLIDVVDSKEFKTYISQSDIGRSAVKYINQQSRITGGSIV